MAETNQLLINYYKKEQMKKIKKMMKEKLEVGEIIKSVNMEWISKEEVLNILGEDYEPVIKESKVEDKHKNENMINTPSVIQNTPMEIAEKLVNNKRLGINPAEHISFLDEKIYKQAKENIIKEYKLEKYKIDFNF